MFKNYHELFEGYVDFYSASLFGLPSSWGDPEEFRAILLAEPLFDSTNLTASTTARAQNVNDNRQHQGHSWPLRRRLASGLASLENYLKTDDLSTSYSRTVDPDLGSRLVEADGSEITIGSFNSLKAADVALIICIFTLLVLAKKWLVRGLANWRWLRRVGMRPKDRERLDECVWRLLFYSFSSTWLIYTCFIKHNSHLLFLSGASGQSSHEEQQSSSFVQYSFEVDWWSYTICMIETAFYVHATYALVYEDVWRRDSPMMLIHHLAAIFSILSIYATRLTQIGLATTVLRDTCDVLLELTKLLKCFHNQRGRRVNSLGWAIKICLGVFTLAFAINQLYYYPLFCLYHALNVIKVYRLQTPVMVGILTCGLVFLLLDCLWFLLILRLLYYIVLSGGKLKDIREYDDDDDAEEVPSPKVKDSFTRRILANIYNNNIDANKTK